MKNIPDKWLNRVPMMVCVVAIALAGTGCTTSNLMTATGAHHFKPVSAEGPRVLHDRSTDSYLVICKQFCGRQKHGVHNRQVQYAMTRAAGAPTPVKTAASPAKKPAGNWEEVPVYVHYADLPRSVKSDPRYAVYEASTGCLSVYLNGDQKCASALPESHVRAKPAVRVLLLGPAVLTDTAIAAAITGVAAMELAANCYMATAGYGAPYSTDPTSLSMDRAIEARQRAEFQGDPLGSPTADLFSRWSER
jgi:hypothetical protein